MKEDDKVLSILINSLILLVSALLITGVILYLMGNPQLLLKPEVAPTEEQAPAAPVSSDLSLGEVVDGKDVETGFVAKEGYHLVKLHCTPCHSSKLVLQNRATREGWQEMIQWMQKTQKLWDLGPHQDSILDYLASNYGPAKKGRRAPLQVQEWYNIP
ncbi:MAG: hypothetical protein AAF694_03330 [Bacteroidota bacterium]